MTKYADYLKKGNKVNPDYLAPLTARPKYSKGDCPGYRFKAETIKSHGGVAVKELAIPKKGYLVRRVK